MNTTSNNSLVFFWFLLLGGGLLLLIGGPVIGNNPIPAADKLTVLFIEETEQEQNLTPGQRNAMHSTKTGSVLDYITNTAKGQWHVLDKDDSVSIETPIWQQAMAAAQKDFYDPATKTWKNLPLIVISNGKAGYLGPVPATLEEIQTLVKKYSGVSNALRSNHQRNQLAQVRGKHRR